MLLQRDDGTALDADGATVAADENTERAAHTALALVRLLERWKEKSVHNAILSTYTDQVQALESAIWQVLLLRLPPYAEGVQLDAIGRVVGEARQGLSDAAYKPRLQARIAMNSSFGRASDVINVIKLVTDAAFTLEEFYPATIRVVFSGPPASPTDAQIPGIVRQTRAAGIGATVEGPTTSPTPGVGSFTFKHAGDADDPRKGFSSESGGADGGVLSYEVPA
jgi:hypothetical protein